MFVLANLDYCNVNIQITKSNFCFVNQSVYTLVE